MNSIGYCPRCKKKFERFSPEDIYCSEECRAELPIAPKRRARRRPAVSLERMLALVDEHREKTGEWISYGELVRRLEGK